ncbi:MAG: hypothetical protein NTV68_07910 [Methanomicrobiales archaeon]|nr:hypothetical protein [Methanomicrobiales archaeon]
MACTTSADPGEFPDELKKGNAMVIGCEKYLHSKIVTAAAISMWFLPWLYPSVKIHLERTMMRFDRFLSKK